MVHVSPGGYTYQWQSFFNLSDDGFSLVPNPESATAAGADHLAQFALLGRILGLSFLHQEPVAAASRLNTALVRLLLGVDLAEIDMCQVRCTFASLCLTFSVTKGIP